MPQAEGGGPQGAALGGREQDTNCAGWPTTTG